VGERVPFYVLLFLPGAPQAGARHPVSARSPGVVVRATHESGSGHRSAWRKIGQVTAWGAHDDSGATNARVVPGWQDLPGRS
jgi:hypothetical protein